MPHQNRVSRALKEELPAEWRPSVYGEGDVAAFAAADPGNQKTDFAEVRRYEHQGGWFAEVGGYNERRGMGDLIEAAGPFDTPEQAAKACGDLVRKTFYQESRPGDRMRERYYGRSQSFGSSPEALGDFDFGGGL